jgi:hypothetical protein
VVWLAIGWRGSAALGLVTFGPVSATSLGRRWDEWDGLDGFETSKWSIIVDVTGDAGCEQHTSNESFEATSSCPRCGRVQALDPRRANADGMVVCECGHRAFAGYIAEAVTIEARLMWLKERIGASDPAPDRDIAMRYQIWPAPNAVTPAPRRELSAMTTQTLLLSLGAGLLIVAATVFTAVNWQRLGAAAQIGLLAGLTVGLAAASIRLRARLAATAEALAVVAYGLGAIDIVGAPGFGLVSESWVDRDHPYLPIAFAVFALLVLIAARRWRLQSWMWLGCLTVAVTAILTTRLTAHAFDGTRSGWAVAFGITSVVGVALVGLDRRRPTDTPSTSPVSLPSLLPGRPLGSRRSTIKGFPALLLQ